MPSRERRGEVKQRHLVARWWWHSRPIRVTLCPSRASPKYRPRGVWPLKPPPPDPQPPQHLSNNQLAHVSIQQGKSLSRVWNLRYCCSLDIWYIFPYSTCMYSQLIHKKGQFWKWIANLGTNLDNVYFRLLLCNLACKCSSSHEPLWTQFYPCR